nr:hypothetical protein [Amycolatopsis marina]
MHLALFVMVALAEHDHVSYLLMCIDDAVVVGEWLAGCQRLVEYLVGARPFLRVFVL